MLQIPILVLFTIFYVSSPGTGPVTPNPTGRVTQHHMARAQPLSSVSSLICLVQREVGSDALLPWPMLFLAQGMHGMNMGDTQVSIWGWQGTVLAGHKGTTLSILQPTNFTLVFSDLHVYASMFSVVLMNYIFMDGKCDYFQGQCGS